MKLPDFLTEWPFGEIVLTSHRIGLYHVVYDYKEGYSAEQIHEEYPTLPVELIDKVLAFYNDNRSEVDAYMTSFQAECERLHVKHAELRRVLDWDEMRRKFEAMKQAKIEAMKQAEKQ